MPVSPAALLRPGVIDRAPDAIGSLWFLAGFNTLTAIYVAVNHVLSFDPGLLDYLTAVSVLAIDMTSLVLLTQQKQSKRDTARDDRVAAQQKRDLTLQEEQMLHMDTLDRIEEMLTRLRADMNESA